MKLRSLAPGLLALVLPAAAHGYSTDYTATGQPIRWRSPLVDFRVDPSNADREFAGLPALVTGSAAHWNAVADAPTLRVAAGPLGALGFDPARDDNASGVVVYRTAPPVSIGNALALTLVTLRRGTGEIVDADIVVNANGRRFAALSPMGMLGMAGASYDIQNTLTHELGHVLGLREDPGEPEATMFPASQPGEVSKRDLSPVDEASVRAAYADDGATLPAGMATRDPGGGCGGARVAPTRPNSTLSFVVVAITAVAARSWIRRGGALSAAFALLVAAVPVLQGPVDVTSHAIRAVHARREGALIVTRALLSDTRGAERWVELPGGHTDDYELRVYGAPSGSDLAVGGEVEMYGGQVMRIHRGATEER